VDSLVMMDICLQIEELTGVTVPDDALYHIETIQDMLSFVNRVNVD
jgi:acyl carrier protein